MANRVVTFGEIMLRLSPPGFLRFDQAASIASIQQGMVDWCTVFDGAD